MKRSTYIFILVCLSNLLTSNVYTQSNYTYGAFADLHWTAVNYPESSQDIYGQGVFENVNFPGNNSFDLHYSFDDYGRLHGPFANNIDGVMECDFTDEYLDVGYPQQNIPCLRVSSAHNESSEFTFDFHESTDNFDLIIFDIDNTDQIVIEATYQGNIITDFSNLPFFQGDITGTDNADIANWNPSQAQLIASVDLPQARNFLVLRFEDFLVDDLKVRFQGGTPSSYLPHFYMSLFSPFVTDEIPTLCEGNNPFSGNTYQQWHVGGGGGIVFNTDGTTTFEELGITSNFPVLPIESSATYCDPITGEVLIYTDGLVAWRGNGDVIPAPTGDIYNTVSGFTHGAAGSPLIVAPPGQCGSPEELYIFFTDDDERQEADAPYETDTYRNPELYYVVVDLINLVVSDPVQFTNYHTSEQINAVQVSSDSIWLVYRADGPTSCLKGSSLYAHLWTSAGLSMDPVVTPNIYVGDDYRYRSAFSLDGSRFGATSAWALGGQDEYMLLCDFNQQTGTFQNPIYLYDEHPDSTFGNYGIAFSPDNSKLYVTISGQVVQFDITSNNQIQIQNSRINIYYGNGGLQNGPDGKIYRSNGFGGGGNSSIISVIHEPNLSGIACNYEVNGIETGIQATSGLQNIVYGKGPAACLPHIKEVIATSSSCELKVILNGCYRGSGAPYTVRILDNGNQIAEISNLFPNANDELLLTQADEGVYDFQLLDANANPGPIVYDVSVVPAAPIVTTISETINEGSSYYFFGDSLTEEDTYEEILVAYNGCDSIVQLILSVTPVAELVVIVEIQNASCGLANGFIESTVSGGLPPYYYIWSNAATTPDIYNLDAGVYSLLLTDDSGQSVSLDNIIVTAESSPIDTLYETICEGDFYLIGNDSYSEEGEYSGTTGGNCNTAYTLYLDVLVWNTTGIVKTDASCGQSNGSITANPSSESGGFYQYAWSTLANTPTIGNLDAGMYFLTVTDNAGCTMVDSVEISYNAASPSYITDSICSSACYEVADTLICNSGSYMIITTNAAGTCDSIIYLELSVATTNLQVELTASQASYFCMQDDDGFISSIITGGAEPYQYSWTNEFGTSVGSAADLNGVPAGEYTLQVTDAYNCKANNSIDLLSSSLDTFLVDASICEGATYQLGENSIDQQGTYIDTLPSFYGCDSVVILTLNTDGIDFTANVNDATCGENNGGIDISISNQSNYSFLWSTGYFAADIDGLAAGIYGFTITDSQNGCTATANYSIENLPVDTTYLSVQFCPDTCYMLGSVPLCSPGIHEVLFETATAACDSLVIVNLSLGPILSLDLNSVNENCESGDGFIESYVSGGIPPYTYSWTDENGTELSVDSTLQNVGTGIYTLEVRDSLGCTITAEASLGSTNFNYISIETILCQGDSFELGGVYRDLPGTYEVTMTNQYGCDSTVHLALDFSSFNFDIDYTDADCGVDNGAASVVISPEVNYQYNWSGVPDSISPAIQNLTPAIYYVTVTNDSNGCEQMDSVVIAYSPVDTSFMAVICPDSCYAIGDTSFCEEGQYNVVLETVEYGCDSIIDLTVFVALPLSISFDSTQTEYYCMQSEGEIFTTVSGGLIPYVYEWTDANGVVVGSTSNPTGLSEGTYIVQVTDSIGCVLTDSITLISINSMTVIVDTMICGGECFEFGSVSYCNDSTQVIDTLVSYSGGCDSIVILNLKVYEINFGLDTVDSDCVEDNGTATVMNPYSNYNLYSNPFNIVWTNFNWNSSQQGNSIDSLSPGMYYVTVRNLDAYNDMGCASMDSFEIDYLPFDSTFVERCEGECFEIGGIEYCEIGTYRDTIEGFGGCDSIVELTIVNDIFIPAVAMVIDAQNTCHSAVFLTGYLPASGDVTGHWSSPDPDIEFEDSLSNQTWAYNLKKGENTILWNLTNGPCGYVETKMIFYEGEPIAVDDYFELSYQSDTILNLTANDDLYNTPTSVRLFVDNDSTIVLNDSLVHFKAPRGFFDTIEYKYIVCNSANYDVFCSDFCDTATVRIKVLPYDAGNPFPDIITPNDDGLNDTWIVNPLLISPQDYPDSELFVFNRWGDRVYHSKPYNNDWSGDNQKNGSPLPESTYYYILYLDIGKGEVYNGQILVNR